MSFFEFLSDSLFRGKCETKHFHIVIDDEIDTHIVDNDKIKVFDISTLPQKIKGTFMHEYLHYIQFNNTLFGLSYGMVYSHYFATCRKFLSENDTIEIPLKIQQADPLIKTSFEKYKKLKGAINDLYFKIDRIEIHISEIEKAKENKTGVLVNAFDIEGNVKDFEFGYLCIIEGMAHQFQTFFDPTVNHSDIPYNTIEIICKTNYPDLIKDAKLLFSICMCSLLYNNPSTGFFEVIQILKLNPEFNGRDLYQYMLKTSEVTSNGEKISIVELFKELIGNYEANINATIQSDLDYYSKVFSNCILEIESGESLLLNLLYQSDISSAESVTAFTNFYGLPFIEFNNLTVMPENQVNKPYSDLARLIGFERVIKRLIPEIKIGKYPKYDPKCPMYQKCRETLYKVGIEDDKRANMSRECENKQWLKKEECLMTTALKWCNVHGKEVNQKELPPKYQ